MITFETAIEIGFAELSKLEVVSKLNDVDKKEQNLPISSIEVWRISTEIQHENKCHSITMFLLFYADFPNIFPKVFLASCDFEKFKYIPHLDNKREICTFDPEISRPDPNQPAEVIIQTIRKAKQILVDGLSKSNSKDFEDEFLSYWKQQYDGENKVNESVLSLLEEPIENPIYLLTLDKQFKGFNFVIYQNNQLSERFILFLDTHKIMYKKSNALLIENIMLKGQPPFAYKNHDVIDTLITSKSSLQHFQDYINSKNEPKLILFKHLSLNIILGWFHKPLKNRDGFRPGKLSNFDLLSTFQKNDYVERVLPQVFTLNRLMKRSDGIIKTKRAGFCFGIAGTGSIGSNLLYFLNTFNKPEFRLIDYDDLEIENIGRHLLGFEYTGIKKTKALQHYLLNQTPLQKITTREKSILKVCQEEPDYINQMDLLFVCVGKTNIDAWVGDAIEQGLIKIPVFFIWVEPYLAGGHCLYITHGCNSYRSYFNNDDLFMFNVISDEEYKGNNPILTLKEANCRTSYIPYSTLNIVTFLSSLFPIISDIIHKKEKNNKSYTWIGDIKQMVQMGITLSNNLDKNKIGTIYEN